MSNKTSLVIAYLLLGTLAPPLLSLIAFAQTSPTEEIFAVSRADIEKALKSLQPSSGRLPILEGFVVSSESALDRYERGYFQYSIQVAPESPGKTRVRVTAKITAWYNGDAPAKSGYRVLPSNGRLEADLFDRLQEALSGKASTVSQNRDSHTDNPAPVPVTSNTRELPDKPGAASTSGFPVTRDTSPALPTREQSLSSKTPRTQDDARVERLAQEARNLEEILQNQAHPQNLTSIKHSQTPIYDRPFDQAKVLFYADAEDEFQLVDTAGDWVHVQISGLSRAWIKRTAVILPGSSDTGTTAATANNFAGSQQPSFLPVREENSMFPGNWSALRGKTVKIIWVQPSPGATPETNKVDLAKSVFRKTYPKLSETNSNLAGVVIVFDSEDGGMAAATMAALQQWHAGHLSDTAFWKQCWLDPADSFRQKP